MARPRAASAPTRIGQLELQAERTVIQTEEALARDLGLSGSIAERDRQRFQAAVEASSEPEPRRLPAYDVQLDIDERFAHERRRLLDFNRRREAMFARSPSRIEIAGWPDRREHGTWYRVVRKNRPGLQRLASPRGALTKIEASRALSVEHGDLPVYVWYGENLYDPKPPPPRKRLGYEVLLHLPDGMRTAMARRSEGQAREVAAAHARAWGLPAAIYETSAHKRKRLVDVVQPPTAEDLTPPELRDLLAELEQSYQRLRADESDEQRERARHKQAWIRRLKGHG